MNDTYREDAIAKVFQKKIDEQAKEIEGLEKELIEEKMKSSVTDIYVEKLRERINELESELSPLREGVGKLQIYDAKIYITAKDGHIVDSADVVAIVKSDLDNLIERK